MVVGQYVLIRGENVLSVNIGNLIFVGGLVLSVNLSISLNVLSDIITLVNLHFTKRGE